MMLLELNKRNHQKRHMESYHDELHLHWPCRCQHFTR